MKGVLVPSLILISLSLQTNASIYHRQQQNSLTPSSAAPTSTTPADTTSKPAEPTTSVSSQSSSSSSSSTTTPPSSSTSPTQTAPPQSTPSSSTSDATQLTTINGTEVTVTVTGGPSSSATSSAPPAQTSNNSGDSSGLGTGSIIGMSVAGGVAVIGIIAFFVWKFTRKRFSDLDGDEAIKWPDLNTHGGGELSSHPLPVHNTGRAGFDTGSEGSLSRVNSAANTSTADFNNAAQDPYAVPPLPHLNPNQPYRDDPAGYYDPYRGPVPGTIEPGAPEWTGEAIPMTQLGASGRTSPAPHVAYGGGMEQAQAYEAGRQSPGPYAAYGGRTPSPGPQAAYGGRMSPGPHAAYGAAPAPPASYEGYPTR